MTTCGKLLTTIKEFVEDFFEMWVKIALVGDPATCHPLIISGIGTRTFKKKMK